MHKDEFLALLRAKLVGLPSDELDGRLGFYAEMIDDHIEEGLSEEAAVAALGTADTVANQILSETPLTALVKEKIKPKKRLGVGTVVLLWIGSPLWLSLLVALIAVLLSVYVSAWAVVAWLWAVFASFVATALCTAALAVLAFSNGNAANGLFGLSSACIMAGLSILAFFGCLAVSKGLLALTKRAVLWLKRCLIGKERV